MAQKILATRSDASASHDVVEVQVDQVVLARAPSRGYASALSAGLKKARVELAIAYDDRCVTQASDEDTRPMAADMSSRGILFGRAGVGFAAPVHLERFASPARLCVTDEPRLAGLGGIGMLSLVVPTPMLGRALTQGTVLLRRPVSVQVLLAGRLRPFVCARDVSLELLRRGLGDVVRRVEESCGAPVVVEFSGPSARLLSVPERAVMAGLSAQFGAAACVFVSDERTEVFLRDQRRSKAHRTLMADAGAPCEEVVHVDLGAIDPLLIDLQGRVKAVRDLNGQPVTQALLGGDGGVTLRDLLAAATFLKSKRLPSRLDFLVAAPSRQMLEVLAATGALADLISAGARIIEPDPRVLRGDLYATPASGVSLATFDVERCSVGGRKSLVVSAETLAYAVATGAIGDPRSFKRPVRVSVPRALPTDDVLVARRSDHRTGPSGGHAKAPAAVFELAEIAERAPWTAAQTLDLLDSVALDHDRASWAESASGAAAARRSSGLALLCTSLDEVREIASLVAAGGADFAPDLRAVIADYIPSSLVAVLSAARIAAMRVAGRDGSTLKEQKSLSLPAPSQWPYGKPATATAGALGVALTWLAVPAERAWVTGEDSAPPARPAAPAADAAGRSREATSARKTQTMAGATANREPRLVISASRPLSSAAPGALRAGARRA